MHSSRLRAECLPTMPCLNGHDDRKALCAASCIKTKIGALALFQANGTTSSDTPHSGFHRFGQRTHDGGSCAELDDRQRIRRSKPLRGGPERFFASGQDRDLELRKLAALIFPFFAVEAR